MLWNTYDDTGYIGARRASIAATWLNIYYIYDLPFFRDQDTLLGKLLGGWQISGATFFRDRHAVLDHADTTTSPASATAAGQPVDLVGDVRPTPTSRSRRATATTRTSGSTRRRSRNPAAGTFGNAPRNLIYNPGEQQWDLALFKNFSVGGRRRCSSAPRSSTSSTTRTWTHRTRTSRTPTSAASPAKSDDRRDIQLSLRFLF